MAKIIKLNSMDQVNLVSSVGRNSVNDERDVLAVQGLLKYALEGKPGYRGIKFPVPTGTLCATTRELIKKYQRDCKRNDPDVKVDGRIDPAKGMMTRGEKAMWTIISLNTDAMVAWLTGKKLGASYIDALCRLYPGFRHAVGLKGVGTLGLELEGGIGTLGLELEGGGVGSLGLELE